MATEKKEIKRAPKMTTLKTSAKEPSYKEPQTFDPRPTLTFSEDELPAILDWTMNKKYCLTVEVEMKGIEESDWGASKGKKVARLKVTKVGLEESDDK